MEWEEILEAAKIIDNRDLYDASQLEAKLANIPIARKIMSDSEYEEIGDQEDADDGFDPRRNMRGRRR